MDGLAQALGRGHFDDYRLPDELDRLVEGAEERARGGGRFRKVVQMGDACAPAPPLSYPRYVREEGPPPATPSERAGMARTGKLGLGTIATGLALALAAVLLALLATPPPADAASRYKTVTRPFYKFGTINIPTAGPATPYPPEVAVGGFKKGRILDANLTLSGFFHNFPSDVDVMLSHGTRNSTVMSDVGSDFDAIAVSLTLDDEAASPMPYYSALATGKYRPTNNGASDYFDPPAPAPSGTAKLSGFDGMNPNGYWQLWVRDDTPSDGGMILDGWTLTIKARVLR